MGIFVVLGLLTVGLLATAFTGGDDGGAEPPPPQDDDDELRTGTSAADTIRTDRGDDLLLGGDGNDTLDGAAGDDMVVGEAGKDLLRGSGGDDIVVGGAGDDTMTGWSGEDWLIGGAGNDSLNGGEGNDTLFGTSGRDSLEGGAGNDVLIGTDVGADFDFGEAVTEPLVTYLSETYGTAATPAVQTRVIDALNSHGAAGVDLLRGGEGDDEIIGDSGDTMVGGSGNDRYFVEYDGVAADFDAVTIRDFDPALERLEIVLADDVVTGNITTALVSGDTVVSVGGVPVAILSDVAPAAVNLASIRLSGGMAPAAT